MCHELKYNFPHFTDICLNTLNVRTGGQIDREKIGDTDLPLSPRTGPDRPKLTAKLRTAQDKADSPKHDSVKRTKRERKAPEEDKKQRKLTDLLNFWQGDRTRRTTDSPRIPGDTQDKTETHHPPPTVPITRLTVKQNVEFTRVTVKADIPARPEVTVNSPARTRIADIRKKFRSRIITDSSSTDTMVGLTVGKRKAEAEERTVTEIASDRKSARLMETVRETSGAGEETSQTGPVQNSNFSNFPTYSKFGQGGQLHREGQAPGRLQPTLQGGEPVQ